MMSKAKKTTKIGKQAKKIIPERGSEKTWKPLSGKKWQRPATRSSGEREASINKRKRAVKALRVNKETAAFNPVEKEAHEYFESIINTVREPLIILDQDLRVVTASRSFYEFFKVKPEETMGKLLYNLGNKQWDVPRLRELLETILPEKATFDNYEVEHVFVTIGRRVMLLNSRQIQRPFDKERIILLAIEDITEKTILQRKLDEKNREAKKLRQKVLDDLNRQVHERTVELAQANVKLKADLIERKRSEERIRVSLKEKEILLKEVHHRVKNNLMTIIGLINMQETKADNLIFNPLLQELESRIRSMALVHEILHQSEDLANINVQKYIEMMGTHIRAQFNAEGNIRFKVWAAGLEVGLDIAVPCGLILNEMIVNAYKHAFPGGKPHSGTGECEISVTATLQGGILALTVADNGVGQPVEINIENPQTLGMRLIKMLSQQINGSIEIERSSGTIYHLKFPNSIA
jgi:PAS domain S-box-containing protein